MKKLQIHVAIDKSSNIDTLQKIIAQFKDAVVAFDNDIETIIESINQQKFDLLIIDKALPDADYNKLHKLLDVLHPDAAVIALHLTDEDFMRYKMSGLMAKWMDAQSDKKINFIDNPNM